MSEAMRIGSADKPGIRLQSGLARPRIARPTLARNVNGVGMSVGLGFSPRVLTAQLLKPRAPDIVRAERTAAYQASNLLSKIVPWEVAHAQAALSEPRVQRRLGLAQSHILDNGHPVLINPKIHGPLRYLGLESTAKAP